MAIVQSFGALQAMTNPARQWRGGASNDVHLYGLRQGYYEIYKSQPNVRICVDFLARNTAQLGLPVYRRVSDTDRVRLNNHDLAFWLSNPNPATTRYRLIEDLVTDLGIYYRAYWLKIRYSRGDGRAAIGLVRLPPAEVTVDNALMPTEFYWTNAATGQEKTFAASEIVHFCGYRLGISPLETLRRILAEEHAAGDYREHFWGNAARLEGVWEREVTAPKWTPEQKDSWRKQWQEFAAGAKAGQTAVGDPGMKFVPTSFNPRDSEYIQGGKLRREVCAAAYHIPQPMVGILEHATFSNIRAQHEHLYQDCLGPSNEMIQQEIERQLLSECEDQDGVYIEFNIDAKMAGTPQDRADSLYKAIGRPWRTVNEGRALENLPRIDDPQFDVPAAQQGATPTAADAKEADSVAAADATAASATIIQAHRARQRTRLDKIGDAAARAEHFIAALPRWTDELAADLIDAGLSADAASELATQTNTETRRRLEAEADRV